MLSILYAVVALLNFAVLHSGTDGFFYFQLEFQIHTYMQCQPKESNVELQTGTCVAIQKTVRNFAIHKKHYLLNSFTGLLSKTQMKHSTAVHCNLILQPFGFGFFFYICLLQHSVPKSTTLSTLNDFFIVKDKRMFHCAKECLCGIYY